MGGKAAGEGVEKTKFNYFFNTFKNMQAMDELGDFGGGGVRKFVVKPPTIKAGEIYKQGRSKGGGKEPRWRQEIETI